MPSKSALRTAALHAYRHLLREASYLPPVARPYITEQIKNRFRDHRRTKSKDTTEARIQKANHDYRYLRAANTGSIDRLRKVLCLVFGRAGRRRRQLLSKFVLSQPAVDSAVLEELVRSSEERVRKSTAREASPSPVPEDWLSRWDTEKLQLFVKSQISQKLTNPPVAPIASRHGNITRNIPTESIWGHPLLPKVHRTKLRAAWKETARKILPPLPRGDWELLREIARRRRPLDEWYLPPRRTPARATQEPNLGGWKWQPYANLPTRVVDYGRSRRRRAMSHQVDETSPRPTPPIGHRFYTPHGISRLYGEIWKMSAMMSEKPNGKGWDITWGGFGPTVPTASTHEFFDGHLDVEIPKPISRRRSRKLR